ncbi:putative ribonuclease H-like domain-containing protein [Tanacetum coccineum]
METQKPLLKDKDGQPKLGLWYSKYSPFDLVAYTDSDYAGATLDRKSTTEEDFANMRRQGKDFSGRVTPLFPTMVVQAQEEIGIDGFCTKLQQRVLDLENTKTAQAQEITGLKLRVKKLEKKGGSRTHKLRRLYKVGRSVRVVSSDEASLGDQGDASKHGRKIDDINADVGITLDSTYFDDDTDMFGVHDLDSDEVVVESEVAAKKTDDEVNVVEEVELKVYKPKVTTATTTTTKGILLQDLSESITTTTIPSKDKGKGIMVEEPLNMKKKDHNSAYDETRSYRLTSLNLMRKLIVVLFKWLKQMQAEEQEELSIEEKSKLFVQLLEARKKHFAAKRNIAGWKPKDLKNKSFANIQELFDKAMKRVNTFVDMDTELVEGSKVRAKEQEKAKKQKVDEDKETAELQSLMEVIPDEEEVAVDAIPLATKPPSIVDWKILKEGKISYYQIIRADGSSKRYSAFIQMLRRFDRENLETLWKLVKAKHGYTRPEEGYERVLWGDLKTMFEHHVEVTMQRNLQGNKVEISSYTATIAKDADKKLPRRIVRIKRLLDDLRVTAAKVVDASSVTTVVLLSTATCLFSYCLVYVSTARVKLVLLIRSSRSIEVGSTNRFLSKGADKMLPFMRTLKNYTSGKMVQWTTEVDEAFQRMKELLEALPTVTAPVNGVTLIVYLAASEESISAVLMAERGKKKVPVYFVSRTLHGVELEYPELEKLILALVLARLEKSGHIAKMGNRTGRARDRSFKLRWLWGWIDAGQLKRKRIHPCLKLMDGTMYQRSYLSPWLRCVGAEQAKKLTIVEGNNQWSMQNARAEDHDLVYQRIIRLAWPFSQWGINIIVPLPVALGGARFGVPQIVISDNRKQFAKGTFPISVKNRNTLSLHTSLPPPSKRTSKQTGKLSKEWNAG